LFAQLASDLWEEWGDCYTERNKKKRTIEVPDNKRIKESYPKKFMIIEQSNEETFN